MTSFDQPIQKLLSSDQIRVVKEDSSFLDRIISWDDWDSQTRKFEMFCWMSWPPFQKPIRNALRIKLDYGSVGYTLAILSATKSVGWIEALVKFIDVFVKYLTRAKFSNKKALHITSRLVKRIFVKVFIPRQGIRKTFKTQVTNQVMSTSLWSILQSLTSSLRLKSLGFKDLDIVASELVKFLIINTGYNAIEGLEKDLIRWNLLWVTSRNLLRESPVQQLLHLIKLTN